MKRSSLWLLLAMAFFGCSKDKGLTTGQTEVTSCKVAVIMPQSQQARWERTAGWALDNIKQAQKGLGHQVRLELEWKDEDAADLTDYLDRVARDESYTAIIGPSTSAKAEIATAACRPSEKTIILPIATSAEFQRINAGRGHVWNLTESDVAQCEILLTQAKLSELSSVSLLASDDNYGRSFSDWFAFQAEELGMKVGTVTIYSNETELRAAIRAQHEQKRNYGRALIFVPGTEDDALAFDDEIGLLTDAGSGLDFPLLLCSDMMNSETMASRLKLLNYEGVSPGADPQSGFVSAYTARFGEQPVNGEAHLYDAVTLLSYALTAKTEDELLWQAMLRVVDGREPWQGSWLPDDMAGAFALLQQGGLPDLSGVTGDWTFDERTHASVLNTTYNHWILTGGEYHVIEYLSTDGSGRTTSTIQAWDWQRKTMQTFNPMQADITYPELNGRWAVVVGTSDTWANYRHQADALAMYQLLKRHGYDDDHILLIIADNIAYDPRNLYQGIVRVRPDGENVYQNVKVDYRLGDITIDDLRNMMLGCSSERLPEVISPTRNDNVIVFWCGHGNKNQLAWGSDCTITGDDVREIVRTMSDEGRFRKMLFAIDACFSGTIGEACEGIPGVLFISAANANEPSKADVKDPDMGIWLSNGFTRAFQEAIDEDTDISMRDLYYTLARRTVGSHATVYNATQYGNMYDNSISEYLGNEQ